MHVKLKSEQQNTIWNKYFSKYSFCYSVNTAMSNNSL